MTAKQDIEQLIEKVTKNLSSTLESKKTISAPTVNNIILGPTSIDDSFDGKMVAQFIDHTILKPQSQEDAVKKICDEAKEYKFKTVCVNSSYIAFVSNELKGTSVSPISVVGFPLGAGTSESKAFETKEAIKAGAKEIDMVVNVGALKDKRYDYVYDDIATVVKASGDIPVKVIIETSLINDEEKVAACILSKKAGALFVKTSTGFSGGGATPEDISLMRQTVGNDIGVKASGGVRCLDDAIKVIKAGASRIGASASVAIVTGQISNSSY